MPTCTICGRERAELKPRLLRTARILGKQEQRLGNAVQTTTTYGEFQEHHYAVCAGCIRTWDGIARSLALVFAIAGTIALIVTAARAHQPWFFAAGLVFLIVGMAPASHLNTEAKLSKRALRERGEAIRGIHAFMFTGETERFKAFNDKEYQSLRTR